MNSLKHMCTCFSSKCFIRTLQLELCVVKRICFSFHSIKRSRGVKTRDQTVMRLLQRTCNNSPMSVRDLVWQSASQLCLYCTNEHRDTVVTASTSYLWRPHFKFQTEVSCADWRFCGSNRGVSSFQTKPARLSSRQIYPDDKGSRFLKDAGNVHQSTTGLIPEDNNLHWRSVDKN